MENKVDTPIKKNTKKKFASKKRFKREKPEYEQRILDLARVTRVMAGGKRMRFRACVAIGNGKGTIGVGLAKGADVTIAINKAANKAKKNLVQIPIVKGTIPHEVKIKNGASQLLFKPAPIGTGIKAGGVVRMILELSGIENISSKIQGTNNKINNAQTTLQALNSFLFKPEEKTAKKKTVKKVAKKTASNKEVKKKVEDK